MTVLNEHFILWEEFFEKHVVGELINHDTGLYFNKAKAFKALAKTLLQLEVLQPLGACHGEGLEGFCKTSLWKDPKSLWEGIGL